MPIRKLTPPKGKFTPKPAPGAKKVVKQDDRSIVELMEAITDGEGLKLHVWKSAKGYQANVATGQDQNSFTVEVRGDFDEAVSAALGNKARVLRL